MRFQLPQSVLGFAMLVALAVVPAAGHAADTGIKVIDVWARPSAVVGGNGAGYFTVENDGAEADTLLKVDAAVSDKVEMHSMTMEDMIMKMRKMNDAPVPPHGKLVFAEGGNHIMFIGLKAPLKEGESFPVTLTFKNAGPIEVTMKVQKIAPMGSMAPVSGGMNSGGGMGSMPGMN